MQPIKGMVMAEAIKSGDMVVSMNGCPKCAAGFMRVFTVGAIEPSKPMGFFCGRCKHHIWPYEMSAVRAGTTYGYPLSWLKKINPPALTESTTTDEKITA